MEAEAEAMSSVLASVSSRKEKAAKAMASLHSHRNLITSCITDWEELERSFGVTERALQQKFKELAEREKEYDGKMQEAHDALNKREESIAGREEASLARVKAQKDTAVAAIVEEKRKLEEEWTKWKAERGGMVQDKDDTDTQKKAAGHEGMQIEKPLKDASFPADHGSVKEAQRKGVQKQDLAIATAFKEMKDVQQNKDPVIGTVLKEASTGAHNEKKKDVKDKEAERKVGQHTKEGERKDGHKKEGQRDEVSKNKRKDVTTADETAAKRPKEASVPEPKAFAGPKKGGISNGTPSLEEAIKLGQLATETPISVQMKSCVDKMDCEGLKELLVNNRKDYQKLRPELQAALQASRDPCRLLLKVLEGSEGANRVSANNKGGHACVLLLECLSEVVADPVLGVDYPVVPSDVKELARTLARRWKSKLEIHNQDGYAIGSHLFLQLLATFGIGTDYSDEDLLHYVVSMSRRGIGPALCRSLGLTDKIPVVVDRLAKEGKQIEAISFASAFGILEKFSPANLLKSYLEDLDKAVSSRGGAGSDLHTKQISALKNAVKVIEEYNLDSQFPMEDLRQRIAMLTRERAENRKASMNSNQEKKSDKGTGEFEPGRPNGVNNSDDEASTRPGGDSTHGKQAGYANALELGHYVSSDLGRGDYRPTDIGQPLFAAYNIDSHYRYERRPESVYDGYGVGRTSMSLSNSYAYPSRDGVGSFPSGTASRLPMIHSYNGVSRDEAEILSNISASHGRPTSYPEIPGSSSNYQLGSGLPPPSSTYLPYYLR
eukprot:c7399_g1_i1 orf=264-2594(+)